VGLLYSALVHVAATRLVSRSTADNTERVVCVSRDARDCRFCLPIGLQLDRLRPVPSSTLSRVRGDRTAVWIARTRTNSLPARHDTLDVWAPMPDCNDTLLVDEGVAFCRVRSLNFANQVVVFGSTWSLFDLGRLLLFCVCVCV
jgi:hypothetical protein